MNASAASPNPLASPDGQLRHSAEAELAATPMCEDNPARPAEVLLHELQVYQVELEMQNEALRQSQVALQASRDRYVELYEFAPVGYLTLTAAGMVAEINLTGVRLLGRERSSVLCRSFSAFIVEEDRARWQHHLMQRAQADAQAGVELAMQHGDGSVFQVHISCLSAARWRVDVPAEQNHTETRMVLSDITERKKTDEVLRSYTQQLQTLSRRVLLAQEAERRRLAIELHDELGQSLTAIKINLQAHARFKDHSPAELHAENIRIVEDALQQVRRLAQALRPSILDDLGLGPALNWMAGQTSARAGFTARFHAVRLPDRLAPEIETVCFRIVQESLTNIARHAQAQQVDIDLLRNGNELVVTVRDDGCGFDLPEMRERAMVGGSLGVLGMQERAALIGGQLEVESARGQGTTVRLRCPLRMRGRTK